MGLSTVVHVTVVGFAMSLHPVATDEPCVVSVMAANSPRGTPPPDDVTDDSDGFGMVVHELIC